jgi:hypothetical protein
MKMSPLIGLSTGLVESGISVKDRNLSFKRFLELYLGPGGAEALRLGWDLEAAEETKTAAGSFGGEEFGDRDFACGIVEEAAQGELRAAAGVCQRRLAA